MNEIRVPRESFDAEAFLTRIKEFLKDHVSAEVDPTYATVWIQSLIDVPVFGPESGWDELSALTDEGKMVFFPFAFTDAHGTLTCADGNAYGPASENEDSEQEMLIRIEDSVGFLLSVSDNHLVIRSAIHAGGACPGPMPWVDLCVDCAALEEPMAKFIQGFSKVQI